MINEGSTIGLITARSGSKRLPNKNILNFHKKPLIAWSIEAALNSKYIDDVIVSTNDNRISDIAKEHGAEVPFLRPSSLAKDSSKSIKVIEHTINSLAQVNRNFTHLVLLQPTSPLRTSQHIDEAIELYKRKKAKAVISLTKLEHPIEWTGMISEDLLMNDFLNKSLGNSQSQEFIGRYHFNGAIYVINIDSFQKKKALIFRDETFAYIMQNSDSIDIDNYLDFKLAEIIMANQIQDL